MADDHAPAATSRASSDVETDAYLATIPPISDEQYEAELAEDVARAESAEEDYAAGRYVSLEAVKRWLDSLGTDSPLPRPQCGE